MSDVFDHLKDQARNWHPEKYASAAALFLVARMRKREIDEVRQERKVLRDTVERRADTNGTLLTFDLHPLEYEAVKLLCPAVSTADCQAKKRAWTWILKQPWAQEFKASKMEKRFH